MQSRALRIDSSLVKLNILWNDQHLSDGIKVLKHVKKCKRLSTRVFNLSLSDFTTLIHRPKNTTFSRVTRSNKTVNDTSKLIKIGVFQLTRSSWVLLPLIETKSWYAFYRYSKNYSVAKNEKKSYSIFHYTRILPRGGRILFVHKLLAINFVWWIHYSVVQ